MPSDRVIIFDTTLRDGEQSPGCSMHTAEKLEIASALVELGVDVIEAGFPIASPGDFEAVQAIARQFGDRGTTICGLARCRNEDIDRAGAALKDAMHRRIHVFLATSSIHRQHKLKMDKPEIIQRAVESVQRAKGLCDDIEFSPEDAARTELDFLTEVVEKAIDAGATTVNIPDTVGYATPSQYFAVISHLKQHVRNIERAVISTHCHDDLGLAVANSLAGLEAGARQVECTINGLGERAGNAALEEIVMALATRQDYYHLETRINAKRLCATSRLVSKITGMLVQRNKAIVGQNAFAHEAGIHQHGMLQERTTYEIMRPEDVGFTGSNLVLGKHSGRHAFRDRLVHLGYDLDEPTLEKVFGDFIALCDKKKNVYDADIAAIVENQVVDAPDRWKLISFHTSAGTGSVPTATIQLQEEGKSVICDAVIGDGPIDAVFNALERITGVKARLQNFQVRSLTVGTDSQGEVLVEIACNNQVYHGKAASTDIIEASTHAYLRALNKAAANPYTNRPLHAQHE
ncbi:MAG: 2-isopropylmalate synthase [Planctomycetaceae bacterium]|nr:2-isopropylmalate synthase [Planctomycetaceae bacterium]